MISCFPDAYPDELFCNIYIRYCERMRFPNQISLVEKLFGTRSRSIIVDFPNYLEHLVERLPPEYHYTADYLIDNHTLLPFYAPFLPPARLNRLREDMKNEYNPGKKRHAGLANFQIAEASWFRYCPLCAKADREHYGECYWHRLHQLPGV